MSAPLSTAHRTATRLLSLVMLLVGIALVVRTVVAGGGVLSLGVVLGILFCAAGAGRLAISRRSSR